MVGWSGVFFFLFLVAKKKKKKKTLKFHEVAFCILRGDDCLFTNA